MTSISTLPSWQMGLIIGGGTYAGMALYNRITHYPNEINTNTYLLKIGCVATVMSLFVLSVAENNKIGTLPSDKILTQF